MVDAAPPTSDSPSSRRVDLAWRAASLAPPAFAVSLWLSSLLLNSWPARVNVPWAVLLLLACAIALLAAGGTLRLLRYWRQPMRQAGDLLELIRAGQAPIDELSHVRGGLRPLIPVLQSLCRDLRQQKAHLAGLDKDMRQRIARRTDALERTIGSLRQQASHDPLTGLCNRRLLERRLPDLVRHHHADGAPLCLLMMDVDHFKVVNDQKGHAAGDQFLRTVAQLLRSTVRDTDLAVRFGGDEFVAVLPGCSRPAAEAIAARLASLVHAAAWTLHVSPTPGLSAGLVLLSDVPQPSAAAFLKEADRRLYAAKARRQVAQIAPRATA